MHLCCLVEDSKSISGNKYDTVTTASFAVGGRVFDVSANIFGQSDEFINSGICRLRTVLTNITYV